MTDTFINPSAEQIAAIQAMDVEGPLVMLNMLRFDPDRGAEEYARYVQAATPFLLKVGAKMRFLAKVHETVIGPAHDRWDEIVLVEYPNKAAFFTMTGDPAYPRSIRAGALADSRLYCSQESL